MSRKDQEKALPSLSSDEARAARIAEIKDSLASRARTAEIRLRAAARLEDAHLALATNLIFVRNELRVGWRELSYSLGDVVGYGYLFKVANRGLYLKKSTFDIVRRNLMRVAYEDLDLQLDIPTWDDVLDNGNKN